MDFAFYDWLVHRLRKSASESNSNATQRRACDQYRNRRKMRLNMLVLKRRVGESITIGNDITITLKKSTNNVAHFAIDAPKSVAIVRTELINAVKNEENTNDEDN